jgi:hypothetical protein
MGQSGFRWPRLSRAVVKLSNEKRFNPRYSPSPKARPRSRLAPLLALRTFPVVALALVRHFSLDGWPRNRRDWITGTAPEQRIERPAAEGWLRPRQAPTLARNLQENCDLISAVIVVGASWSTTLC